MKYKNIILLLAFCVKSKRPTYAYIGYLSMMFSLSSSNIMLTLVLLLCGTILAKESSNGQLQQENHDCPPWMYFNNATQSCQCGPTLHKTISCVKDGNRSDVGVFFRFTYLWLAHYNLQSPVSCNVLATTI